MKHERPAVEQVAHDSDGLPFVADPDQHYWEKPLSRRGFLGASVGVVAAYHMADVETSETFRWTHNDPEVNVITSEGVHEKYHNHMTVLVPGLGVPGSSASSMVYALKPYLQHYGDMASIRYPDNGLTDRNFQRIADTLQKTFKERQVEHVSFICHSAGGPNLTRILRAPVDQARRFFGFSYGEAQMLEPAWQYWQQSCNVQIDNVTYVSSPPTGAYIKGAVQQGVAKSVSMMPESLLKGGVSEKWIGNLINNHTVGYDNFMNEKDRWAAAWRSAMDDYPTGNWLTQLPVIESMGPARYRDVFSPDTNMAVAYATVSQNDPVVVTDGLLVAWALMHDRPLEGPGAVADLGSPDIGHADIASRPETFGGLFAGQFGIWYPMSPADIRLYAQ